MTEITGNHPTGAPSWVDIGIPDLARAKEFYGSLFGWEFADTDESMGYYTICTLRGRPVAALMPNPDPTATDFWWNLYFATDDTDGMAKRITDHGGSMVMEPMDVMDQGRMALALDPEGAQFGLWHGRAHTGIQIVNEPGTTCWHELSTTDTGAAAAFYGAVLGRPVEQMDMPDFDYRTVKVDSADVAGLFGVPDRPARWTSYFGVADTDRAALRVTETGGEVRSAPKDSPYGRVAVVADPFGAEFAIMSVPS